VNFPGIKPGQLAILRYENQEFHAAFETIVSGKHCFEGIHL